MNWIIANWESVMAIVAGVISVASVIAKLTPTETDNVIVGKLLQIIDLLAINNKPTQVKKKLVGP